MEKRAAKPAEYRNDGNQQMVDSSSASPSCRTEETSSKYSQLDLSLFKFLQRPLPLLWGEPGGELSRLNSTKELHQQVKPEEDTDVKKSCRNPQESLRLRLL